VIAISSEDELIKRAQAGDREAFCQLAERYGRRIYTLALHYCRHRQDAEDITQEVWLSAYKAVRSFRGEASFYTWLRQITVNAFLKQRRAVAQTWRDEAMMVSADELESISEFSPWWSELAHNLEEEMHNRILVAQVSASLDELTPQQRLIFLLKHREGMTYEEISGVLNCSVGTIKKTLFRAVLKLREHMSINVESADCAPSAAGE